MKSTKRILSALLSLCMILSCVAVGFTAQAASFPTEITEDFTWTGGDVTLEKSLKIENESAEPIKVDLGNATVTGPAGKTVVNIIGNVEVYNGTFLAVAEDYQGEKGFLEALVDYKPAVTIFEGDVVLDCVTAVGSVIRVPNSSSVKITSGNGIAAMDGNVTLKHVIACGLKALDNTYASVTVEDAILVGIYKAVNIYNKVDFAEGYDQYDSVDFLKGLLQDGISLTAKEEEVLRSLTNSQGDISCASIVANVKAPALADLTHTYADNTLKVYAQADVAGNVADAKVPNRYSYQYTPNTCTIGDTTVDFVADGDKYVAEFTGMEAGTAYDAVADYDLAVKLGNKQKEVLAGAIDTAAAYAEKAPELLYRFVKDFEELYTMAWTYATLFYNAKNSSEFGGMFTNDEGMMRLYSIVLSLVGENFDGFGGAESDSRTKYWSNTPSVKRFLAQGKYEDAFAYAAYYDNQDYTTFFDGTLNSSVYGEINGSIYYKRNADFSGIGVLEQFDKYYNDIMSLLYTEDNKTQWNDPVAAAQYVGDNWKDIYELAEAALVLIDAAEAIIDDPDLSGKLDKILGSGSLESVINMAKKAFGYLDGIKARADKLLESDFVKQYGDKAGDYCAKYTKKALNILNNLDEYFELNIEGDYVTLSKAPFDFAKEQTIETPEEVKPVRVDVSASAGGYATLDEVKISTADYKLYDIGEEFVVNAVVTDGVFSHMVIVTDGNETIVESTTYTAKAATNIEINVVFKTKVQVEEGLSTVTYMTDKALGYKFIDSRSYSADDIGELSDDVKEIFAPNFKDLTLVGWALDKNAVEAVKITELVDEITVAAAEGNVFVYAIYDYKETVVVPVQKEAIKMTAVTTDADRNYFEVTIQVPEGYNAIEAGVIATKNAALATEDKMTVDLSGKDGVGFGRVQNKGADGYVSRSVVYTQGVKASDTVYARGYIVLIDADGNSEVHYTEIASSTVGA